LSNGKGIAIGLIVIILAGAGLGIIGYNYFFAPTQTSGMPDNNESPQYPNENKTYYCSSETELREALNKTGSANGKIYLINDINISDTIEIDGGGKYEISGLGAIKITVEGEFNGFEILNATSCVIRNLKIYGPYIDSFIIDLIYISEVNNNPVYVQNVELRGSDVLYGGTGIHANSEHIWIQNCLFESLEYGIEAEEDYVHIEQNTFLGINYLFLRAISIGSLSGAVVGGNIINYCHHGIHMMQSSTNSISNNIIKRVKVRGIYLEDSNTNTITGNIISTALSAPFSIVYGIQLSGTSMQNTINGNTIYDINPSSGQGDGISLQPNTGENIVIGNNLGNIKNDYIDNDNGSNTIINNHLN